MRGPPKQLRTSGISQGMRAQVCTIRTSSIDEIKLQTVLIDNGAGVADPQTKEFRQPRLALNGPEHSDRITELQPPGPTVRGQSGRQIETRVVADRRELPGQSPLEHPGLQVRQFGDGQRTLVGVLATGVEERDHGVAPGSGTRPAAGVRRLDPRPPPRPDHRPRPLVHTRASRGRQGQRAQSGPPPQGRQRVGQRPTDLGAPVRAVLLAQPLQRRHHLRRNRGLPGQRGQHLDQRGPRRPRTGRPVATAEIDHGLDQRRSQFGIRAGPTAYGHAAAATTSGFSSVRSTSTT